MKRKRRRNTTRVPKQNLSLTIAVIVFLLFLLFFSRFGIFRFYLNRKLHHFNRNSHVELKIDKISFNGLCSVSFNKLLMVSKTKPDTVLAIDSANIKINIFSLITLPLFPSQEGIVSYFSAQNVRLHLIDKEDYNNFLFLFNRPRDKTDERHEKDYAKQIEKLFKAFFYRVPSHIDVNNIYALIEKNENKIRLHLDSLSLQITDNGITHPLLRSREGKGECLNVIGLFSVSKLIINNPRIAPNDVSIAQAGINFNINVGNNYIELDSSSVVTANKLNFNPYVKITNNEQRITNNYSLTFIVNKEKFPAQELFESFPKGMFSNLDGIKTKGELEYHLNFNVDFSNPDSLKFSSNLKKHNFGIISFGKTNLTKLNSTFPYTAYDKNIPVRTFTVGNENPDFVPLNNISHYLVYSVLTSEDGGFYINNGFNEDAFRESIIKNIKEKRFARGGSTITMQLVKNVFLNRNKNIGRKLEEVLLVWLIENNNLCSKDRMLEVYLNIIEWGPRIYGIGEASKFYFDKKPANLTLAESIYLASIIPHPKWYKYSFNENGDLRDNMKGFFKLVSEKMLRKEYISQSDADNLKAEVKLKGPSLKMLMKDTLGRKVNIDSLLINSDQEDL